MKIQALLGSSLGSLSFLLIIILVLVIISFNNIIIIKDPSKRILQLN